VIAATLALGTVAVEPERAQDGSVHIWLDPGIVDKVKALCGPGESYSDVIIRLAAEIERRQIKWERTRGDVRQ
jgi:hypothetical protein